MAKTVIKSLRIDPDVWAAFLKLDLVRTTNANLVLTGLIETLIRDEGGTVVATETDTPETVAKKAAAARALGQMLSDLTKPDAALQDLPMKEGELAQGLAVRTVQVVDGEPSVTLVEPEAMFAPGPGVTELAEEPTQAVIDTAAPADVPYFCTDGEKPWPSGRRAVWINGEGVGVEDDPDALPVYARHAKRKTAKAVAPVEGARRRGWDPVTGEAIY